jgi:ATP-binding cassette, subfamily A (ABC1), member 3
MPTFGISEHLERYSLYTMLPAISNSRENFPSHFILAVSDFGPIIITLGLLYPVAVMASYIAQEKELRQKELLKMMSVSESDIGWSWFVTYFVFHFFTATFVAFISDLLYDQSTFPMLWIFWILTFIGIIVFCMTVGALTSKAIRAVLLGVIVFLIGAFLPIAVPFDTGDTGLIGLISLHPVAAFSYGLSQIGQLEDQGIGLTLDTLRTSSGNESGYSFANSLTSLMFDCLFWGFLCWYYNRVIKPDYGQALPFYFLFTSSYWCPSRKHTTISDDADAGVFYSTSGTDIPYEPVGEELRRQAVEGKSIEIHNLCKKFGEKTAVDGLKLSMYSGQITALLGHNGAGKTTTIAMLTGAMGATDGYAVVAGKDIRTDMEAIRQDIGICLQHDCLFPMLTVREHIQFFSRLKGLYSKVSFEEAETQIDQVIRDVALFEKRNTFSKSLSGGMKRKLSVAIAFSGGSKVVLLDEPTSGMDPFSRRFTWNVIRQYRQDRCIILTTHFMDEADILGDRIAIMAEGQLRCAGSSMYLKKMYGVGYQLTIEKSPENRLTIDGQNKVSGKVENGSEEDVEFADLDDVLKNIVKSNVPESNLLTTTGSEVRYQLPMLAASRFPKMFEGLDTETDKGTIQSYGVSITTLDEVFLLVARGDHRADDKPILSSSRKNLGNPEEFEEDTRSNGKSERSSAVSRMDLNKEGLFFRHVSALTRKRAANFSRDKKAWVCTTMAPTLAVFLGLLLVTLLRVERNLEPITLSLDQLNADVSEEPINPIFYNSPSDPFLCQPAMCGYNTPIVESPDTNEIYGFCGYLSRTLDTNNIASSNWTNPSSCSLSLSTDIMSNFDRDGAPQEMNDVGNVYNVSLLLLVIVCSCLMKFHEMMLILNFRLFISYTKLVTRTVVAGIV